MKITFRTKTYLLLLSATLGFFLLFYGILWRSTEAELRSLQRTQTEDQVVLVKRILDNEMKNLAMKESDWAKWDDTYQFISDRNSEYIASNLGDESLVSIGVHMMAFVNNTGELVYGKQVYAGNPDENSIPEEFLKSFTGKSSLLDFSDQDTDKRGILVTPEAMLLVVAQPITTSDGKGVSRGTLFFARYIDSDYTTLLSELSGMRVQITPYGFATRTGQTSYPQDLRVTVPVVTDASGGSIAGFLLIHNIFENPSLVLSVEHGAAIIEQGRAFLWQGLWYVFFSFVAYVGILVVCIEMFILRKIDRIRQVVREVNALHADGLPDKDIDDFSYLAAVMKGALEKNQQSDDLADVSWNEIAKFRVAIDQSFDHTIITDAEGKILYANAAAEQATGFSRVEMQGKTPSLWGRQMDRVFYEEFWDKIRRRKEVFEGLITNKRKDGTLYKANLRVAPILDDQKRVLYFIGIERLVGKG